MGAQEDGAKFACYRCGNVDLNCVDRWPKIDSLVFNIRLFKRTQILRCLTGWRPPFGCCDRPFVARLADVA